VDGKVGSSLAPYFRYIPFLPKDSRIQHVRNSLKRHGINFDSLLLLSTQLSSDPLQRGRESISSSSSANTEEDQMILAQRNKLQTALRKRLHSLEKLLNHENDNVRKVCLLHICTLVRGNRELFHGLVEAEGASLRFLTVKSNQKSNGT